jgi:hypothetical protein
MRWYGAVSGAFRLRAALGTAAVVVRSRRLRHSGPIPRDVIPQRATLGRVPNGNPTRPCSPSTARRARRRCGAGRARCWPPTPRSEATPPSSCRQVASPLRAPLIRRARRRRMGARADGGRKAHARGGDRARPHARCDGARGSVALRLGRLPSSAATDDRRACTTPGRPPAPGSPAQSEGCRHRRNSRLQPRCTTPPCASVRKCSLSSRGGRSGEREANPSAGPRAPGQRGVPKARPRSRPRRRQATAAGPCT